ncbi:hypothetical protein PMCN06_2001 [Pasteurella multocida subsp. multocida str. HN06]|nr:hypothetical protein PMCN06_2001 [Pasteurella multocida subsp. multocida str. HN06]
MIKVRSDFTNFVKVDRTSISENLKIWFLYYNPYWKIQTCKLFKIERIYSENKIHS